MARRTGIPDARAAILGLTRDSGIPQIVRAALGSVGYQTRDLMNAMQADLGGEAGASTPLDARRSKRLRVDGGMVANDWLCQFLADILDRPVERPVVTETTALGAACLAGLEVGLYPSPRGGRAAWRCARRFEPTMAPSERARLYGGWLGATGACARPANPPAQAVDADAVVSSRRARGAGAPKSASWRSTGNARATLSCSGSTSRRTRSEHDSSRRRGSRPQP